MRFIPVNCIREGMVLGKKLVGKNGELLLQRGAVLHSSYMEKITQLGYSGMYIEDDLSHDIEISDVINEDLRHNTVKLVKRIFTDIETKGIQECATEDVRALLEDIVDGVLSNRDAMVNMIDLKVYDDYTYYHSTSVTLLSLVIGTAMNLNKKQMNNLGLAAILHDIGKVFIPKEVLNKPGRLTRDEYRIIQKHSELGYQYLKEKFEIPAVSYVAVLQHHERFDGMGYPNKLQGEDISTFARIISLADVYDALVSKRAYREALSPSEAMEYIMGGSDTSFDPDIVLFFCQKIAPYPVGTCVRLSNNASAIIAENFATCGLRPLVKVIRHDNHPVEPYYLNLKDDKNSLDIVIVGFEDV